MAEFEFVVEGPPYTANNDKSKPKIDWKQNVGKAAYDQWVADGRFAAALPLDIALEISIATYCDLTLYDVDNVLKWTLDGLKEENDPKRFEIMNAKQKALALTYSPIYKDDKFIYKLISERIEKKKGVYTLNSPSALIEGAIQRFSEFLHITLRWQERE